MKALSITGTTLDMIVLQASQIKIIYPNILYITMLVGIQQQRVIQPRILVPNSLVDGPHTIMNVEYRFDQTL